MSSGEAMTICPFCLYRLSSAPGKCEKCGRLINPDEWTAPSYVDDVSSHQFSSASIRDLQRSLDIDGQYYPPAIKENHRGILRTDIACAIDRLKGLRIGSDSSCGMVVEGCGEVLSIIVDRNQGNGNPNWWIYDFSKEAGAFVNRKRVLRVRALTHEDRIEVAGVTFKFECRDAEGTAALVPLQDEVGDRGETIIKVANLTATKDDGGKLLDAVDFEVCKGEFVAVMGPSGCGKSSLIQRIAGLAPYDSGIIEVKGEFAYLPQDVERSLHSSMTLEQEIQCYRKIYQLCEDDAEFGARKDKVLRQLNLRDKSKTRDRIGGFSGGEKRRVGLALALLRDPKILLLDEPFAGLDPENERKLTDELYKLAKNDARTIVCVTHGLANKEVFDRLLILGEGGIKRAYDASRRLLNLDELLVSSGKSKEAIARNPQNAFERLRDVVWRMALKPLTWKSRCVRTLMAMKADFAACVESWPAFERVAIKSCLTGTCRVVAGYLFRYWNENICGNAWYKSNLAVCCLWQPLIIVVGIRLACAFYFVPNHSEGLTFCMALALFWLSDISCSRELVRNRMPSRCLERLGGVSTPAYLLSKYLWAIGFCLIQTLVFAGMVWLVSRVPLELSAWKNESFSTYDAQMAKVEVLISLPMFVVSLLGGFCGLAMSAMFRTELKATAWATNLAIFALLFSDCIVKIEEAGCACLKWIVPVVKAMPSYWPSQWMNNVLESNWNGAWENILLLLAYLAVTLALVCFFEWKNERSWQGRDVE